MVSHYNAITKPPKSHFSSADRAKQIQNYAKINTDPTEKIILDLKEENEKLKRSLEKETMANLATSAVLVNNTAHQLGMTYNNFDI